MTHEPARDTIGRFAPQEHSDPELDLTEHYLDDDTDGADFNVHDFYDSTQDEGAHDTKAPSTDPDELFSAWLEESRTPQGMDEYFDRPNPALAVVAPGEELPIGAWGNAKPF